MDLFSERIFYSSVLFFFFFFLTKIPPRIHRVPFADRYEKKKKKEKLWTYNISVRIHSCATVQAGRCESWETSGTRAVPSEIRWKRTPNVTVGVVSISSSSLIWKISCECPAVVRCLNASMPEDGTAHSFTCLYSNVTSRNFYFLYHLTSLYPIDFQKYIGLDRWIENISVVENMLYSFKSDGTSSRMLIFF